MVTKMFNPFRYSAEIPKEIMGLNPDSFNRWCEMKEKIAVSQNENVRLKGDGPYLILAMITLAISITIAILSGYVISEFEETKRAKIQLSLEQTKLDIEKEHSYQAYVAQTREAAYWAEIKKPTPSN
jgi:spore coat polysaccharide biosynthesis protein SpsF (cytidylyltransferase family)